LNLRQNTIREFLQEREAFSHNLSFSILPISSSSNAPTFLSNDGRDKSYF